MENLIPGIIMAFRESLEAFLIIILVLKFLKHSNNSKPLTLSVFYGFISSVLFALILGFSLSAIGTKLEKMEQIGTLWESIASLVAVGLVTTFIIWMIKHGSTIKNYVEEKAALNMTKMGIFTVSFVLVAREGVEIAIFSFAGKYDPLSIIIGISLAVILALGLYFSLVKISLPLIFKITLLYLIVQAGYLFGYGLHEGLSALAALKYIQPDSLLLLKSFDVSNTMLNHKTGLIGIPLNILLGWHSKPEWIQLISQYILTFSLFGYWINKNRSSK